MVSILVENKPKLLLVDDDKEMLGLLEARFAAEYELIRTIDAEQALGLALEHKPNAIILDLAMPKLSGFELSQGLRSLTYTATIPIFVITGAANQRVRQYCSELGIKDVFQKPIDFLALSAALTTVLKTQQAERREHTRVKMHLPLLIQGIDKFGRRFEEQIVTENVSQGGLGCRCATPLFQGATVDIFSSPDHIYVGQARVVRIGERDYGLKFVERTADWILQSAERATIR